MYLHLVLFSESFIPFPLSGTVIFHYGISGFTGFSTSFHVVCHYFHAYRSHLTVFASSYRDLARMLNSVSWQSPLKSINCVVLNLIKSPPRSSTLRIQSHACFLFIAGRYWLDPASPFKYRPLSWKAQYIPIQFVLELPHVVYCLIGQKEDGSRFQRSSWHVSCRGEMPAHLK